MSERINISDDMDLFIKICKLEQPELKAWLINRYSRKEFGFDIIDEDGFLHFIPQEKDKEIPVCLTAHMDTVHEKRVKKVRIERHKDQTIISSPQGIGGDDRCGIYMICRLLDMGHKPYVVFNEDEEIGCVGAKKFCKTDYVNDMDIKFIIEMDRRNGNDAVYYDLDNEEFEEFVTSTTGYVTASGSVSDISYIAPEAGVAAVNLSCGYYKEHTLEHYVVWEEMERTLEAVWFLLGAAEQDNTPKFEYKEKPYYGFGYGKFGSSWYDTFDYGDYTFVTIKWIENGKFQEEIAEGYGINECVGKFLIDHPYLTYNEIVVEED